MNEESTENKVNDKGSLRELSRVQSYFFAAGAVMMVAGVGGVVFHFYDEVSAIVSAVGAIIFALMQLTQTYSGTDITIRRLRSIMNLADVCFILYALMQLEGVFHMLYSVMATSLEGYSFYIHYVYNNWPVFLLIGAILEMYTIHRVNYELDKE